MVMLTVGFALGAALVMFWSGGSWGPVLMAYLAGGWTGFVFAMIAAALRGGRD